VAPQPTLDRLIGVGGATSEFVFVLYLHREKGRLFVGLPLLFQKGAPTLG
jgi:hypothetical protein